MAAHLDSVKQVVSGLKWMFFGALIAFGLGSLAAHFFISLGL